MVMFQLTPMHMTATFRRSLLMAQDCLWMQLGRDHWWDVAVKIAVSEHGVYPQVMARSNGKSLRQMKVVMDNIGQFIDKL